MEITNNKPKLLVKLKNIQLVFDYCIENKLKFSVAPRLTPEEWEIEMNITDIMSAISLGVFIRENRIDVIGLNYGAPKVQAAVVTKNARPSKTATKKTDLLESISSLDVTSESDDLSESESSAFTEPVIFTSKTELAF